MFKRPKMSAVKKISWIIPCYNEEVVISHTIESILNVVENLKDYAFELIFVDDGSLDNTRSIIKSYSSKDSRVKLIGLSRNFGHQFALQSGLDFCQGAAVIVIDADLQDPPELASEMINLWEQGYDVVYGKRVERLSESYFKRATAGIFYRVLNLLSDISIPKDTGDFRLIDRKVVHALKEMPEKARFIRGLISWAGYKQVDISYQRKKRFSGKTKYSMTKMITLALEGITSFSSRPLRLATIAGVISASLSFLGIVYILIVRIFTYSWVEGWATLAMATLLTSGIQLICLGILGEYIGRIYLESKARPMYFIDESLGFDEKD